MSPLRYWNPYASRLETEKVYGDAAVAFLYQNRLGKFIRPLLTSNKLTSRGYGYLQSMGLSRRKIDPFVKAFQIKMDEFVEEPYGSFNDFFVRKFRPGARTFVEDPQILPAPCEARYLFFNKIGVDSRALIKGALLNPAAILQASRLAAKFHGGSMAIARLCPVDYHRFHFPDDCKILETTESHGKLESVNPLSVACVDNLFLENERAITILSTKNFGHCAMVEVGALCVGKIHQSYDRTRMDFKRGDEKGYFLFGGSTVVLFFEPDHIQWKSEFLAKSQEGIEVFVKLGDPLGRTK
jgi:phosphatidylserine decarboxylase